MSCWPQPPGLQHWGGQAHLPGDGTRGIGCFGRKASPRAGVPSKGYVSPRKQRLSRSGWDGHSMGKGLFPLTPHDPPGSPAGAQHHCWGCCRARGVPTRGGMECLPPKDALWRQRASQPAPWGLLRTLYLPRALNLDNRRCRVLGACQWSQKAFCNLSGYQQHPGVLPPLQRAVPPSLPAAGVAQSHGALPFPPLFIQPPPEISLGAQGWMVWASSNTHFCVRTCPPRPRTSS